MVDGFVFSSDAGRHPWLPNWVTKRFITYRRRAGLAAFRLHDLRRFMATTMLAAGVPAPVVSERLCHPRTSTTVNIYAHAMPGGDRATVKLLAEHLTQHPTKLPALPRKPATEGSSRSHGPGAFRADPSPRIILLATSDVFDRHLGAMPTPI